MTIALVIGGAIMTAIINKAQAIAAIEAYLGGSADQ